MNVPQLCSTVPVCTVGVAYLFPSLVWGGGWAEGGGEGVNQRLKFAGRTTPVPFPTRRLKGDTAPVLSDT